MQIEDICLWCSFDRAEPVLQRGLPTREGLLTCGERGRITSSSLPNPAWIASEDLNRPFRWVMAPPPSLICKTAHTLSTTVYSWRPEVSDRLAQKSQTDLVAVVLLRG